MYCSIIKPSFDVLMAFFLLILLSPVILLTSLVLLIANRSTPFFIQPRPGKNSIIFKLIKFKTMNTKQDVNGNLLPDQDRLSRVGRFIRSYSIDEIPQLINVLKGDMSLVGPRPLLVKYLPLYNEIQTRRHEVKPGITGWTQVNGRNSISWQEKFELDVWYVDNISLSLDVKILFLTIKEVLLRKGINSSDEKTMPSFNGNN